MSSNPLTSPPAAPPAPNLPPLVVTPASVVLAEGETQQFTATLNGQPVTPKWSSSDPSIAQISPDGIVRITPGDATQARGTTVCAAYSHDGGCRLEPPR